MPSKSRHSRQRKVFKAAKRAEPEVAARAGGSEPRSAASAPATAAPARPATITTPRRASPAAVMQYPYIRKELIWIGGISAFIVIVLIVLKLVL